jgi:hypothetical protein
MHGRPMRVIASRNTDHHRSQLPSCLLRPIAQVPKIYQSRRASDVARLTVTSHA